MGTKTIFSVLGNTNVEQASHQVHVEPGEIEDLALSHSGVNTHSSRFTFADFRLRLYIVSPSSLFYLNFSIIGGLIFEMFIRRKFRNACCRLERRLGTSACVIRSKAGNDL